MAHLSPLQFWGNIGDITVCAFDLFVLWIISDSYNEGQTNAEDHLLRKIMWCIWKFRNDDWWTAGQLKAMRHSEWKQLAGEHKDSLTDEMLRPSSCQHLSCLMTGVKGKDASRGGTQSRRVSFDQSANESTQMTTVTFKPDSPTRSNRCVLGYWSLWR